MTTDAGAPAGAGTPDAPGAPAGGPGVADLDPAAALGAAIHGGSVSDGDGSDDGDDNDPEKLAKERDKWKAMSRKNETRARENAEAARKLAEIEDRDKTELQRATDRAVKAEERATAAERRIWAREAADAYEIPARFRDRITGITEEEITASAESLAKDLNEMKAELGGGNGQQPAPGRGRLGGRPVESMRPGAAPSGGSDGSGDSNDLLRGMISRARGR